MARPEKVPQSLEARLAPAGCAILIIDMQNDFCASTGYVEKVVGRDASACRSIVTRVRRLVDEARRREIPIVWVAASYDIDKIPASMRAKQLERSDAVCCAGGEWGSQFYELSPAPQDEIVVKHAYSAFIGTSLAEHLRDRAVQTLIFAGVQTNVCLEHSVRDAFCLGFKCVVVSDCVASHMPSLHDAALSNLRFFYGSVLSLDELAEQWLRGASLEEETF